jgi:hypothetical protein
MQKPEDVSSQRTATDNDERRPLISHDTEHSVVSSPPSSFEALLQGIALVVFVLVFGVVGTILDTSKDATLDLTWVWAAQIMGWASASFYRE